MEGGLIIVPVTWEAVRVLGHENQGDGAESRGNHMEPGGHACKSSAFAWTAMRLFI